MPGRYPVPMELRGEDKVVGDWLSMRQLGVLAGGLVAGVVSGGIVFLVVRMFGGTKALGMGVAAVPVVVCVGAALILGFLPAGWMGILPGPNEPISPDPYDPPMRIDQWLRLWRSFNKKSKLLPFRREGYVRMVPLSHWVQGGKERRVR